MTLKTTTFPLLVCLVALAFVTCVASLANAAAAATAAPAVSYDRDILPILSDNCYPCHGPDEKARKAKLRLDTKEGAFRVKDDVAVIVPGKPGDSELIRRITSKDPDEVMPPPKSQPQADAAADRRCSSAGSTRAPSGAATGRSSRPSGRSFPRRSSTAGARNGDRPRSSSPAWNGGPQAVARGEEGDARSAGSRST